VARRKSKTLTEAEHRLMEVLWNRGPSTVNDVMDALPDPVKLAYNTVLTTMRILERKGFVKRTESQGRALVFEPLIDQGEARRSALDYVLGRFFNNSPELLVLSLLDRERLDPNEIERLKRRIAEEEK
jgi:predicted transcriptional regulator